LLKIGFLELFKVSLTENHLQSLFLFLLVLLGFYQQISEIFQGLGKSRLLDSFISNNTSAIKASVVFIALMTIVLLVIAILSSVIRVFLMHFNLTVYIRKNTLEIYQGLTNKKSIILKKDKIQHIKISTNPIKKKLGISFITFKQAVSGKVKKKKDKIIKIVGCKITQILEIKKALFLNDFVEYFSNNQSNIYYKYRLYFRTFIFLTLFNFVYFLFLEQAYFLLINILLILIIAISIEVSFKKRIYKFSKELIMVSSGIFETHKTFLPFFKVQNIKLKQSIFQEQKNVADLVFQTASGKVKIPCIELEKASRIYNYTLFKIETSTKSWI
jgi:putative membrane protein